MEENFEQSTPHKEVPSGESKSGWQSRKESWYDRLTVTVEQLNRVLRMSYIALGIVAVLIVLDALGIIG